MAKKVKEKKINLPSKKSINFISDRTTKVNRISIIAFVVFLLFLALFVKFGVIDPLARVNRAEAVYRSMEAQLNGYKEQLKDYDKIDAEYNEMVGSFLSETELSYLDRMDIIKMVEEDIKSRVAIQSITLSGNTVRVVTGMTTMNNVSDIVSVLDHDTRNSYVTVTTAQADSDNKEKVTANIVVSYSGRAGE